MTIRTGETGSGFGRSKQLRFVPWGFMLESAKDEDSDVDAMASLEVEQRSWALPLYIHYADRNGYPTA